MAEHTFLALEATWKGNLQLCLATLQDHDLLLSAMFGTSPPHFKIFSAEHLHSHKVAGAHSSQQTNLKF